MYRNYTIKTRTATSMSQVGNIQQALTNAENEGVAVADLDAAMGTTAQWQALGLKGSPVATKDYTAINVVDGVITMSLTGSIDAACNGQSMVFTPTFGANATTWAITHTCTGDADVVAVIDQYIARNVTK